MKLTEDTTLALPVSSYFLPLAVLASVFLVSGQEVAAQGLTTEEVQAALTLCAAGSDISFDADLAGSIAGIYQNSGGQVEGTADLEVVATFLSSLPESDRIQGYQLYLSCIKDEMARRSGQYSDQMNEIIFAEWESFSAYIPVSTECGCVASYPFPNTLYPDLPEGHVAFKNECDGNVSLSGERPSGDRVPNPEFSAIPALPSPGEASPRVVPSHIYSDTQYLNVSLAPGQVAYVNFEPVAYLAPPSRVFIASCGS
ncbi:hypothetical protein [Paracoccus sp. 08]|uniref:hypothetical protein n=1 Tax=Paracoccus sp. 08 TaxID=2606624 RepID=UPI00209531AE|nr:hypothetical protein [Paracoccus sp. 08]MCO6361628.1 hypothetical protein [Paracoccus sp. 08]